MKKHALFLLLSSAFSGLFLGCQKMTLEKKTGIEDNSAKATLATGYCYSCGLVDNMPTTDHSGDTTDLPTILGLHHVNPYLLPNIQKAYNNLGVPITATVTNLYVRFLPNSAQQLATLDSLMDLQGLDLFDIPMDYDVTQEGDYYQDPTIPMEQVTYQYAVVPTNFVFPTGIAYTLLASIHIPDDNYTAVETEAERLADNQDSLNAISGMTSQGGVTVMTAQNVVVVNPNSEPVGGCPQGQVWDGHQCIPNPQPPYTPPPPAPDASIPQGNIQVYDYNLKTYPGLRIARIVVKRWFKIQRMYTDNTGHFLATKHFKHKVKVVVKFKNNYANVKGVRGFRIWQMYLPIAKTTGIYSGNKSNILYQFLRSTASSNGNITTDIGNRYWVGATVHNSVLEHRDYAAQYSFALPPNDLSIMINDWGAINGLSSSPLFKVRHSFVSNDFFTAFIGNGTALTPLNIPNIDILIDYYLQNPSNPGRPFSSDFIKETIYHELTHASQYTQAGSSWFNLFFNSEISQTGHWMLSKVYFPYGDGTSANSPIIALGEGLAYHMGFYLAGQRYGNNGDSKALIQDNGISGLDLNTLETFVPKLSGDGEGWIPKGIFLDLIDNSEPSGTVVVDGVSGYTNQQIFGALQSDVQSVLQYKARLLSLYGTTQQTQVQALFLSYGN